VWFLFPGQFFDRAMFVSYLPFGGFPYSPDPEIKAGNGFLSLLSERI
jgi:hypothetical protein